MIPADYVCGHCGADGVKLWRKSATSEPVHKQPLLCGACTAKEQGHTLDLSESDQCWGRCPAIPDLRGGWWGYTSVPAEGCAWWDALPLKLTGEWKVRGGKLVWMPYRAAMQRADILADSEKNLRRIDFYREGGAVALVFVREAPRKVPQQCGDCHGDGVVNDAECGACGGEGCRS